MARLLKSFFYKLFRDATFRVVAIIGACLAVGLSLMYGFLVKGPMASGVYGLLSSISPSQNFGIAVPINLAIFITLLFNHGIIRNEIIVGNSKVKIYFSLLIGGLAFILGIMIVYVGLTVGILSLVSGGFFTDTLPITRISAETIVRIVVVALLNYILISAFTIFISTTTRSVGASVSLVVIPIVILSIFSMVVVLMSNELISGQSSLIPEWLINVNKFLNPQYAIGKTSAGLSTIIDVSSGKDIVTNEDLIIGVVNNLVCTLLFTGLGAFIFKRSDVK